MIKWSDSLIINDFLLGQMLIESYEHFCLSLSLSLGELEENTNIIL